MTPMPEDDEQETVPRRSALSPLPELDDEPATAARRSAISPLPDDEPESAPRRSAMSPVPEDEEETVQLPLPKRSREYAAIVERGIQLPLPAFGPVAEAPAEHLITLLDVPEPEAVHPPPDPSVQATLPSVAPTPSWQPSVPSPEVVEPEPEAIVPTGEVVEALSAAVVTSPEAVAVTPEVSEPTPEVVEGSPFVEPVVDVVEPSTAWHAPAPWPLDPDDTHALFRRPAPGEPETQWDLTPISAASPDEVVPPEQETTITAPTRRPGQASRRGSKPVRARGSRRHLAWRDHRRLFTVLSIVVALLVVVGVGGYLFSRVDPTLGGIAQGKLSLPLTAGDYTRDPAQGVSPSVHPDSKISTVSATYSRAGLQQFVVIAYRPQTDPEAALQEIQARSVARVAGGACGRTTDQNLACVVISGTTAVLAVTLVDQTADDLIASAQLVAEGLGKS
jgi:hypothetical protein